MAIAGKNDPLKNQKDSLNFRNTAIDRLKQGARTLLRSSQEGSFVRGVQHLSNQYPSSKLLKRMAEVHKSDSSQPKKSKNPLGRK